MEAVICNIIVNSLSAEIPHRTYSGARMENLTGAIF